jgi:ABC-type multidrug transport system ATPase subunit
MRVELVDIGKRFQNHSIFNGVNLDIPSGYRGVILGGNGSGKSTLLKIISGALEPSQGTVSYFIGEQKVPSDRMYQQVSFCGPYTELIEDFTLPELIDFQAKFKAFLPGLSSQLIRDRLNLERFKNQRIKTFSSGMKQRVRLALSIMSNTALLLLDEPTSNLDPQGKTWYMELVTEFAQNKTILVASNHLKDEYAFATHEINLHNYQ